MRHRPIHWSEGMFLRPQHFQAADRHWEDRLTTSERIDNAFNYGVYEIAINEAALAHYQLEIQGCKARLKDGSLITFDSSHVDRIDLRDGLQGPEGMNKLFVDHETVTVYLAIPQLVEGRANVTSVDQPGQTRYVAYNLDTDDESAGGNRQRLSFRDFNFRVLLSTDDRAGYECLPICRIKRSPRGDETAVLDPDYFPPCVRINAWPQLGLNIVRVIYDMLAERLQAQHELVNQRGITLGSQEAGDLERMLFLSALNQSIGQLANYAFIDGVHPLTAYQALCEIIGRLSIFGPNRVAPDFPRYDHDDLATIFKWALEQIRLLIYQTKDEEFEQRYFVGHGFGMSVALERKWFSPEWSWYIGIDPGSVPQDECFRLLASGKIDWKLGSSDQVDWIFKNHAQGVKLVAVKQVPRALPTRGNWVYFSISKENEFWKHVELTNSLAIRIKEEQINNLPQLQNNRKIIVAADNKLVGLEFAVFAVRKRL